MDVVRWIVAPDAGWLPAWGPADQAFFRAAYGVLLAVLLLLAAPQARRFFLSDRFGGYAQGSPAIDRIQNPRLMPLVLAVWTLCALGFASGRGVLPAAVANVLLCHYFFVRMRWRGVLRGMGAPGFMTWWLALVLLLLEVGTRLGPVARGTALLYAQVDFALIMLSAGIYKYTAGYPQNHGVALGLVNPEWGYWWRRFKRVPPLHPVLLVLNQLAWFFEVLAGVLMLVPATRFLGALLIMGSFVFIAATIRLGVLAEMVILCGVLFFHPGSLGDLALGALWPGALPVVAPAPTGPAALAATLFVAALWVHLALTALCHVGLYVNFYGRRRLPGPLQGLLDAYAGFFGIIIWRVFSVDVVGFFIRIHVQPVGDPAGRRLLSRYGVPPVGRFSHVGESIAITSVFTTLKYYPHDAPMFRDRLLRYAHTLPCPEGQELVFEYVHVQPEADRFEHRTVAEFVVDPRAGTLAEHVLDPSFSIREPHAVSPVHAGDRPGSYAPRGT